MNQVEFTTQESKVKVILPHISLMQWGNVFKLGRKCIVWLKYERHVGHYLTIHAIFLQRWSSSLLSESSWGLRRSSKFLRHCCQQQRLIESKAESRKLFTFQDSLHLNLWILWKMPQQEGDLSSPCTSLDLCLYYTAWDVPASDMQHFSDL